MRQTRWGLLVAFVALSFGAWFYSEVSGSKASAVWFEAQVPSSAVISLPKDDAPHQAKMEWWYYNGHLLSESGKKYSFHDTTFLVNGVMSYMVNHVSVTDYQSGQHLIDQRSTGGNLSTGSSNRFDFSSGDWSMTGNNGVDKLRATANGFGFDLDLISLQAPVFHGKQGIVSLDSAGASYYYSRPRMAISGTLTIDGKVENVKGLAWFDHQWGDFATSQLAWDWFSLQLDDHSDIMIYQLRGKANKPILNTATITENGKTEILNDKDFSLKMVNNWASKRTGIKYPIDWQITIPSKALDVTVKPFVNDCEFDARLTTYNVYWEGAVQVTGTHAGRGFMELNGYSSKTN